MKATIITVPYAALAPSIDETGATSKADALGSGALAGILSGRPFLALDPRAFIGHLVAAQARDAATRVTSHKGSKK